MKKVLCVLCIMLCALSTMFASGSTETAADSDRPVVRVYCGWAETQLPNWRGLVEEYNSNPDNPITIQLEFFGSSGYFDRLNAEFLAGDPPEVFQLTKTVFNEYSAAGRLYDLRDYLAERGLSETLNKGAQAWAGPLVNETGGVYGFPDFANTSCIFYNTKMFEEYGIEEPTDMESLREAARILNEHGKKAIVTGASDWCATDLLAKVQAQLCGTDILIDAYLGKAAYNDPILVEALTIVDNMVKENIIDPSSADYNDDEAIAEFVSGNAGMYTAHTAMTAPIDSMAASMPGFEYNIIKNIDFVEDPLISVPVTWGQMWCVPADCDNIDGALEALTYLFGEYVANDTVEKVGKIYNVESWNKNLTHPALRTAVDYQMPSSATADSFYLVDMVSSKVLENLNRGIQQMIQGRLTPQEVLDTAQQTWLDEQAQRQ